MTEADDVLAKLTEIFRDVFDDDTIVARPDMTANEVERWDSLSHIDMLLLVEEGFGIRIPTREIVSLMNVGDLVRLVIAKRH
jgi:acyl carrier protein